MIIEEQIRKRVVAFGNGSIVYTPKDWIDREVIVTLPKSSLREEIFAILEGFFDAIQGIYLYGSYARNEAEDDSDIDILVIASEKFKIKKGRYDINALTLEEIKKAIKHDPLYTLAIREAKVILNKALLEGIKDIKFNKKNFKWILETTASALKVNEELIKREGNDFKNYSCVFSLVLRLRTLYMMNCILKGGQYSNKKLREFAKKHGIANFNKLYKIYRAVRGNKAIEKIKISKGEIIKLYELIQDETRKKGGEIN